MTVAYLLVVGLAGLVFRLVLLERSGWLLEGDDALSTLMALGILDGDRPLMLKQQPYAAAWQPYAMAASYALFGVSRLSAKLPALVASLLVIATTWVLAREVGGPIAARFAAALASLPPIYFLVVSLKPFAPYTEVVLLGSLSLAAATRLAFREGPGHDAALAVGCGVAGGLAFWMHPLAVVYLPPTAGVVLGRVRGMRLATAGAWASLGFALGGLPVWLYNLQTGGATVRYVLRGTRGEAADHLAVFAAWWRTDLPRAIGLSQPWGPTPWALGAAMALVLVAALGWALLGRPLLLPRLRPLDGVLGLLVAIPLIFVLSGFGGLILNPWGFDATGRYGLPIWAGLAAVLGAFLAAVWRHRRLLALALAAVVLTANVQGWAAADAVRAFQSTYWAKLPVDNGPLLAALRSEGIEHVWLNHWAAFPLMFDARAAGQRLVAYDWYDVQAGGIDRFPEYLPQVERADRVAFVLVTDEPVPELEARLQELGVSYHTVRIPPYRVVIPASRRVHPSEVTDALDYRY